MTITKKTVELFVTADGSEFKSEQTAIDHEDELKFNYLLGDKYMNDDVGYPCISTFFDFKMFITTNKEYIQSLLK